MSEAAIVLSPLSKSKLASKSQKRFLSVKEMFSRPVRKCNGKLSRSCPLFSFSLSLFSLPFPWWAMQVVWNVTGGISSLFTITLHYLADPRTLLYSSVVFLTLLCVLVFMREGLVGETEWVRQALGLQKESMESLNPRRKCYTLLL